MGEAGVSRRSGGMDKRKRVQKSGGKMDKRNKVVPPGKGKKIDKRMKQLFRKRARDYNSDDEDSVAGAKGRRMKPKYEPKGRPYHKNDSSVVEAKDLQMKPEFKPRGKPYHKNEDDDGDTLGRDQVSDDEDTEMQPGITKFTEGCRAFRMAFVQIMKKHIDDDLGPILSAQKKLVIGKLAEEEEEKKVKSDSKKEKLLVAEKGHLKPVNYIDSNEKFLISVATKGVVKLFNAVNKAQNAQKGLNPSRTKDAKVLRQRRKQVFLTELGKASGQSAEGGNKGSKAESEQPSWGPLRDTYMLTNQKLKHWDKMEDMAAADDIGMTSDESSDDE